MNLNKWLMQGFFFALLYGLYLQIPAVTVIYYITMSIGAVMIGTALSIFEKIKEQLYESFSKLLGLLWLTGWVSQGLTVYVAYLAANTTLLYFYVLYLALFYTLVLKIFLQGKPKF